MMLVKSLNGLCEKDKASVGPKALSISKLASLKLPVPPGFVITGETYHEHLTRVFPMEELAETLENLTHIPPAERRPGLREIRRRIIDAPPHEKAEEEIRSFYRQFENIPVAVRSSGTSEDLPDYSFAGMHDTFLDIRDFNHVIQAVKECWASLWTDRAFEYRTNKGFSHLENNIAVIIQEYIPARAAGVIFTADPVTGETDRIIIESVNGPGEGLVSGKLSPDRYVYQKKQLCMIEFVSSSGQVSELHCALSRKNRPTGIENQAAAQASLSAAEARSLAKLARNTEKSFRTPIDMEWVRLNGKTYFIQVRPITTLTSSRRNSEKQVWSNLNLGEVLPGVVTPMTYSIMSYVINKTFELLTGLFGVKTKETSFTGLVAGRIYFDLNNFARVLRKIPGAKLINLYKLFGGFREVFEDEDERQKLEETSSPPLELNPVIFFLKIPYNLLWFFFHQPGQSGLYFRILRERLRVYEDIHPENLTTKAAAETFLKILDEYALNLDIVGSTAIGISFYSYLFVLCRSWFEDATDTIANNLLTGTGVLESANAGLDLWKLARSAHEKIEVERILLEGNNFEATSHDLEKAPDGQEFLLQWNQFMKDHGHHTRGELEIGNPRWSEDPDTVLDILRSYLGGIDRVDPLTQHQGMVLTREKEEAECMRKLKNPIQKLIFSYILKEAQLAAGLRENVKSESVRGVSLLRKNLMELGKRWKEAGIIEDENDVFFLYKEEILPTASGNPGFNIRKTIEARREEYQANRKHTPPPVVVGVYRPEMDKDLKDITPHPREVGILKGVPVSSGIVTGKARVIMDTESDTPLAPGEILVAPRTDPGWTPYFVAAAGVVIDQGGILSHGSIVAREYGIPAVVNVGNATRQIKTGQLIQIDGYRGVVRILSENEIEDADNDAHLKENG